MVRRNFSRSTNPTKLRTEKASSIYEANPVTCSAFSIPLSALRRFHSSMVLFLSLIALCACTRADVSKAKPLSSTLTDSEAAGLGGDASTDIHAVSDYSKTISGMLEAGEFEQLDGLAESERSRKETFSGGMWKIHAIYSGLERPPLHATQEDWEAHIESLQRWVSARPESITARIALAESYVNYGADARGAGFADTVSESGWKLLAERTAKARQILERASSLSAKDPEWYFAMQNVALAQSWGPQARQALLDKAVKFEPAYYYYYRAYANSILPKWGGEEGEAATFLTKTADQIGGDVGDIMYFRVAGTLVCGCQTDQQLNLSWPRIQKGFAAVEKQNGPAVVNWNLLAHMAQSFDDAFVADKMFAKIGDQWSEDIWQTSSSFESAKQWAKQMGPFIAKKQAAAESAEANLQTPEGQRYKAAFEERIHTWMQPCVDALAGKDSRTFELLVKVGKEGAIDDMTGSGGSPLMPCLANQLNGFRLSKQVVLPPPPQPAYWVQVDPNPEDPASAASK